ncbi:hypothetical protein FGO68_gene13095 [Halteria grandinella]|uniref:Uncharacterized protein n=1 Tax=Halteria grandinella TaxID=5974 RepID=A0A8J8NAV7_HALGN|nr:hypothetical protein FGO68_gene13095 [Halteria grandinella]
MKILAVRMEQVNEPVEFEDNSRVSNRDLNRPNQSKLTHTRCRSKSQKIALSFLRRAFSNEIRTYSQSSNK